MHQILGEIGEDKITLDSGSLVGRSRRTGMSTLPAGTQLGPYQIEELIGRGGMGEVYRARDTRLHRTVAIKILPAEKTSDAERQRRFMQEARAASALNHPNIVTLYDVSNHDGISYLVMEYVRGTSLDKLIVAGKVTFNDAVNYTVSIANALASAHAAGIVHRDIKPANVMVTPDSNVKVLDFGLAKLLQRVTPASETRSGESSLTSEGTVMGTVGYMPPEQVLGLETDHRSDIFSLGVVLYEMLSGHRPFRGESHVDTMHAIVHDPFPPLTAVPQRLEEILDRALAKDPKKRYQHASDFAIDLQRLTRVGAVQPLQRRHVRLHHWRQWAVVSLAIA